MRENLCPTCIHREGTFGGDGETAVESLRFKLDDPIDKQLIDSHPDADKIIVALNQPRPARCQLLAEILPQVAPVEERRTYSLCPEINLSNVLVDEATFAQGGYDTDR